MKPFFRSLTMPNLSIKDVPEAWAEALRQRALRNHRSLQGELMAIVEAAVAPVAVQPMPRLTSGPGLKTVQQVMSDLRVKYPEPVGNAPLGRDIVRAERDAR
jgi:plasmid stability protein